MAQTFKGTIINDFPPEGGVNIAIKGLDKKKILAPTAAFPFEQKQDGKELTLTLVPSSGTTEAPCTLDAKVKKGKKKIATSPDHWEVKITSEGSPTEIEITIFIKWEQ